MVRRLIAGIYSGKIPPKIGAGLAPLLNLQLRAIETVETTDLDRRLARLEKLLAEAKREEEVGRGETAPRA